MVTAGKRLFGTSGIRGDTLLEITPQLALSLGIAYGKWLNKQDKSSSDILIGCDPRYGSDILAQTVACGLSSIGHNCHTTGIIPTGQFAFNIASSNLEGGVLVTGSHMPYYRTGMILFLNDGSYASHKITDEIEKLMNVEETTQAEIQIENVGHITPYESNFRKYLSFLFSTADTGKISKKKFKLLIDPANGSACNVTREIFERLHTDISIINHNCKPIPNRPSEPLPENIEECSKIIKVVGYDLGMCFDMDADRVVFLNNKGDYIDPNTIGAILALHTLKEDDMCVVPVNTSSLIDEVARRSGFQIQYCKIGQPETIEAIKQYEARFSFEETGKYYFAEYCLWSDAILTAIKLLEIMASENKTLEELTEMIPRYYSMKTAIKIPPGDNRKILDQLENIIAKAFYADVIRRMDMDGTKLILKNNTSIMFRLSGTEPLLRLYCDGKDYNEVKLVYKKGEKILKQIVG